MKRRFFAFGYFVCAACLAFGQPDYLIRTGHTGSISDIEYHAPLHALVSAGEDGKVKVWDTERFTIMFSRRIAPHAVSLLSLHPEKARFAAAYENDGKYRISVWDWTADRELYSLDLPFKPLFMDFSPHGTYLAVCVEDWNSLFLFNAENGDPLDFSVAGSGIVTYVTFSGKETTLMTYQPSGRITYWELGSAKKIGEFRTRGGLVPLALSNNKLSLVCSSREGFVFLDAVTGKQTGTADVPGLIFSRGDRTGTTLAAITRVPGGRESVTVFAIAENAVKESYATAVGGDSSVTALAAAGDAVYAGKRSGEVYRITQSGAERVVKNNLLAVTDMAVIGDKLVLGAPDRLLVLKSDFFAPAGSAPPVEPSGIEFATFNQPFPGSRIGLAFHGENGLYVWSLGGAQGALDLLDARTFSLKNQTAVFSSPLRTLSVGSSFFLSIEKSGVCRVNGLNDRKLAFEYQTAGLNHAVFIPPGSIVLGKSNLSSYESSLAVVAGRTGETTYLPEPDIMVYDLAYDDRSQTLYYTGIEKIKDVASTVVKMRTRDLQAYPAVIYSKPGRFLFGDLACDGDRGRLYFSVEDTTIRVWDGTTVREFEDEAQEVRKIIPDGNTVYALNDDSSITAWDANSLLIRFTVYFFENGAWLLITRDGRYCSGGGTIDKYVRLAEGGADSAALLDRYKLGAPVTSYVKD